MSFTAKFTDDQRAAVVSAQVEGAMTATAAVEAGAAGELGVEAFVMSRSTAANLAWRERRRRSAQAGERCVPETTDRLFGRAATLLGARLEQMHEANARGEDVPAREVYTLTRAIRELGEYTRSREADYDPPSGSVSADRDELEEWASTSHREDTAA